MHLVATAAALLAFASAAPPESSPRPAAAQRADPEAANAARARAGLLPRKSAPPRTRTSPALVPQHPGAGTAPVLAGSGPATGQGAALAEALPGVTALSAIPGPPAEPDAGEGELHVIILPAPTAARAPSAAAPRSAPDAVAVQPAPVRSGPAPAPVPAAYAPQATGRPLLALAQAAVAGTRRGGDGAAAPEVRLAADGAPLAVDVRGLEVELRLRVRTGGLRLTLEDAGPR